MRNHEWATSTVRSHRVGYRSVGKREREPSSPCTRREPSTERSHRLGDEQRGYSIAQFE